jgi:prenylcysteine oxidase/farnesylcysteine lyase
LRLAIVGAGIGGCSAAHYARSRIPDLEITVFEAKSRLGGRVCSKKVGSAINEIGATFFLPINKNIQTLVDTLGIETEGIPSSFGIWDGAHFVFKSNRFAWLTKLNLLSMYGRSAIRLFQLAKKGEEKMMKSYSDQDRGFPSYEKLIEVMDSKWSPSRSFEETLLEEGIAPKFIKEILEPFTRLIYCQGSAINGFAGITAMIGVLGNQKHIKKGNDSLPGVLIETAKAEVRFGQRITRISRSPAGTLQLEGTPPLSEEFDAVILAAPIEDLNITFYGIESKIEKRRFQKLFFKTITGAINKEYFGLKDLDDVPKIIMTTANSFSPFVNLVNLGVADDKLSEYHLIATKPISEESLDLIFRSRTKSSGYALDFAYPVFNLAPKFQPILIDKNLYYINGIESAASTMESSVLGAKNAVMLLQNSPE